MFEQYGRSAATKAVVLVSDNGGTSQPPEALTTNIASITNDGIHIFAIGSSTVVCEPHIGGSTFLFFSACQIK